MDYYAIGQRIRKVRKEKNLSQEQLAEQVNISTTHLSHIETGNTKLSLPVLVNIAVALNVSTDFLLFDVPTLEKEDVLQKIVSLLDTCTVPQANVILDLMYDAKSALDKYM